MDLSVKIGGIYYPSLISNAAGTVKTLEQVRRLSRAPVGAVRVGSYMFDQRAGNEGRVYWISPDGQISFNALGIPGPGYNRLLELLPLMANEAHKNGKPLIVSIAGSSMDEFGKMARLFDVAAIIDGLEVNAGCPNLWSSGNQKPIISYHPESLRDVLHAVEKTVGASRMERVGVKVSPFFFQPALLQLRFQLEVDAVRPDIDVFNAVVDVIKNSGVSHVVTMNTVPRVRKIVEDGKWAINSPHIPEGYGGLAGPGIYPLALTEVNMWKLALVGTSVQVVGAGGISSGDRVARMRLAGAVAVQVGTAFYNTDDPRVFEQIVSEYINVISPPIA